MAKARIKKSYSNTKAGPRRNRAKAGRLVDSSQQPLKRVEERLAQIESQLHALRSDPVAIDEGSNSRSVSGPVVTIRAHFGRAELERKPFVVTFGELGKISRTLTPIRAAILIALLLELLEKSEPDYVQRDNVERVRAALIGIAPEEVKEATDDAIRVALYRAGQFIKEEFSAAEGSLVSLEIEKGELLIRYRGQQLNPSQVEVDIGSSDQLISAFLDQSLATSPLTRLRKSKALYVPGGKDGQDRLLLEILDHEYPVKQTTLFYRPTVQSLPSPLAAKLKFNTNRSHRQDVALKAYQSGRLHYTEILHRSSLWGLAKRTPDDRFSNYEGLFTAADVIQHLDHLLFLIQAFPNYELVITDAFLPFYISTFEIVRPQQIEHFVLFFQNDGADSIGQASTFGLRDDSVYFNTHEKVIGWVLSHPTTIRSREQVMSEIEAVRNSLIAKPSF